jgi:hypothetical protein
MSQPGVTLFFTLCFLSYVHVDITGIPYFFLIKLSSFLARLDALCEYVIFSRYNVSLVYSVSQNMHVACLECQILCLNGMDGWNHE